jgi:hypothetical protein
MLCADDSGPRRVLTLTPDTCGAAKPYTWVLVCDCFLQSVADLAAVKSSHIRPVYTCQVPDRPSQNCFVAVAVSALPY